MPHWAVTLASSPGPARKGTAFALRVDARGLTTRASAVAAHALVSPAFDAVAWLVEPGDPGMLQTVAFLSENCFHSGGFFQDMIHSGINPYLTLCIAQTLLRCGDTGFRPLVEAVAEMASPTGQWPEAIHPHTGGGCMGDGQHGWAAAEWVMMIRNIFLREEGQKLILGEGIFPEWLDKEADIGFGPTQTPFGPVAIRIFRQGAEFLLALDAHWHNDLPLVEIRIPGFYNETLTHFDGPWKLKAMKS